MKKRLIPLCSAVLLWAGSSLAQGTVIYDQLSFTGPPSYDQLTAIAPGQPFGQSFTPSLQAVGFINLVLDGGGTPGSLHINVMSGSMTGTIVGSSSEVTLGRTDSGVYTFNFNTLVAVNPGTTYYFQPVIDSGGANIATPALLNPYGGGTAYYRGNSAPNGDLEFQEGIYVPEPSTWALALLGAGLLIWMKRR